MLCRTIKLNITLLDGVPGPLVSSTSWACFLSAKTGDGRLWLTCELAFLSSRSSGTGASLLGTGVNDNLEVLAEKFGLLVRGFLGLLRSGSLRVLVALGVLLKNDWMLF